MCPTVPAELRNLLLAAIAFLVVASPAQASPFVIGIEGGYDWPAFGVCTRALELQLAKEVVTRLKSRPRLRYWTFEAMDRTTRASHELEFRFSAVELQPEVIALRVEELRKGSLVSTSWGDVGWLKPADFQNRGGYAAFLPLTKKIADAFADSFFAMREEAFRQELETSAPLAVGGSWTSDPPSSFEIVVPLPWDQYKDLRQSEFRIQCFWPRTGGRVIDNVFLQSFATGADNLYSESGIRFRALVVIARRRAYAGGSDEVAMVKHEVHQLHPRLVYLAKETKILDPAQDVQVFRPPKPRQGPPS